MEICKLMMENCILPKELLIEILAKLPVKSLVRFKSVCKFFYNLIKHDLHFMRKHYEISCKTKHIVLLEARSWCQSLSLYHEESEPDIVCLCIDEPKPTRGPLHLSSCHGVLCLVYDNTDTFTFYRERLSFDVLVSNPSTLGIKPLPSITVPYDPPEDCAVHIGSGFGFGLSNNMSWKVVILIYFRNRKNDALVSESVMVYSQVGDSGSWRQIDAAPHVPVHRYECFYLKGRYYWQVLAPGRLAKPNKLVLFDMDDELFGTIELPVHHSYTYESDEVTVMNETVAFLNIKTNEEIEIWLMCEDNNDVGWHKHVSISVGVDIYDGFWNEVWHQGIRIIGNHLFLFPNDTFNTDSYEDTYEDTLGIISIDLVTRERKKIHLTRGNKDIEMGYREVYDKILARKWKTKDHEYDADSNIFQGYNESLFLL